jgi:hypothetical protein
VENKEWIEMGQKVIVWTLAIVMQVVKNNEGIIRCCPRMIDDSYCTLEIYHIPLGKYK